jgi:hypothetical protein
LDPVQAADLARRDFGSVDRECFLDFHFVFFGLVWFGLIRRGD